MVLVRLAIERLRDARRPRGPGESSRPGLIAEPWRGICTLEAWSTPSSEARGPRAGARGECAQPSVLEFGEDAHFGHGVPDAIMYAKVNAAWTASPEEGAGLAMDEFSEGSRDRRALP